MIPKFTRHWNPWGDKLAAECWTLGKWWILPRSIGVCIPSRMYLSSWWFGLYRQHEIVMVSCEVCCRKGSNTPCFRTPCDMRRQGSAWWIGAWWNCTVNKIVQDLDIGECRVGLEIFEHFLFHGAIPAFNHTRLLLVLGGVEFDILLLEQLITSPL